MIPLLPLLAEHDYWRIGLAVGVSLAACLCVFKIRGSMRDTSGVVRWVWLFIAGLEVGVGLWANQFLTLLALPIPFVSGRSGLGPFSILPTAVVGAVVALAIAWHGTDRARRWVGAMVLAAVIALVEFQRLQVWPISGTEHWDAAQIWFALIGGLALFGAAFAIGGAGSNPIRRVWASGLMTTGFLTTNLFVLNAVDLHPIIAMGSAGAAQASAASAPMVNLITTISIFIIGGGVGAAYLNDMQSLSSVFRLRRLADAAREGIVVVKDGRINDANTFFCALAGRSPEDLVGQKLFGDLLKFEHDEHGDLKPGEYEALLHARTADGVETAPIPVLAFISDPQSSDDQSDLTIVSLRDLREQRAAEDRIRFLADHDPLSGLPNRKALLEHLSEAINFAHRTKARVSVICLNLDRFKLINELHGQAIGDELLVEVGRRIARYIGDQGFAARIGGDEFAVARVSEAGESNVALAEWTHELMQKIRAPLIFTSVALEINVRAGVSLFPQDGSDADRLLANADTALRRAREHGKTGYCFFEPAMDQHVRERRGLARDLRLALAKNQLEVAYQPLAGAESGDICGFEALMRWRHPERGLVPPDQFIQIAEEEGLIQELGHWILGAVAQEAATWSRPLSVAVNISAVQLSQRDLAERVRNLLFETGLSPSRLVLEVTETALITEQQAALDALRRLKALGLCIAMDDFGTGFSSLSTLHSFPFDKIKIDKSFVDGIGTRERSTVIVRAVLGIGRGLGIPVVAEGVENAIQLDYLRREGCAEIQGYYIGKPAPISAFTNYVFPDAEPASEAVDTDLVDAKAPASLPDRALKL